MFSKRTPAVIIGVWALAFIAFGLSSCSSSTTVNNTNETFTSDIVNSHTHTVTLTQTQVMSPPAGGISLTTSSNSGHTHSFAMTQAQLTTVNGGTDVNVVTGSSDVTGTHTHEFAVSKWF
jgi:hypothetical protein